jgi:hypothetical protein
MGHVAQMGEIFNYYKVSVNKESFMENNTFGFQGTDGGQ